MITQIDKFDMNRANLNPFAYFTTIAYHQTLITWYKEKRQTKIKDEYRNMVWDKIVDHEDLSSVKEHDFELYNEPAAESQPATVA